MDVSAFDTFVQEEQAKTKASADGHFDPERGREEWLSHIDDLYTMVLAFLQDYIATGQVAITYRNATINEEYVGDYEVRQMLITIGAKVIRLEPIGTFLIGWKGRVDVVGPILRAQLMLTDKRVNKLSDMVRVTVSIGGVPSLPTPAGSSTPVWVWRLVTRPPERRIVELTREVFLSLLVEIGNG